LDGLDDKVLDEDDGIEDTMFSINACAAAYVSSDDEKGDGDGADQEEEDYDEDDDDTDDEDEDDDVPDDDDEDESEEGLLRRLWLEQLEDFADNYLEKNRCLRYDVMNSNDDDDDAEFCLE
jgi:hypothetical protein